MLLKNLDVLRMFTILCRLHLLLRGSRVGPPCSKLVSNKQICPHQKSCYFFSLYDRCSTRIKTTKISKLMRESHLWSKNIWPCLCLVQSWAGYARSEQIRWISLLIWRVLREGPTFFERYFKFLRSATWKWPRRDRPCMI